MTTFYLAAAIAILSTAMVITRSNAVHALLYLVVSLLAVGIIFFVLGAPFAAALEVIIYAGAIMVLFAFVVMMLSLGSRAAALERRWMPPAVWIGPGLLALILAGELAYLLFASHAAESSGAASSIGPARVGRELFGPYLLAVELASVLLLAALAGAYHLGREITKD
jgi:NADH-quinone oxidoreductase subunit J